MKKKSLCVFGLLSIFSLVNCGGNSGVVTHVVDQPLPEDDPSSPVEILFWHCLGQAKRDEFKNQVVDPFNQDYRGKYHVTLEAIAGSYDDLADALTTYMQSGTVPALTMGYPDFFSTLMTDYENRSAILRLDSWIDDPVFGLEDKEDFIQAYYEEGTNYQHEGTWSLPLYKSTEVLYYNKSFFMGYNKFNQQKFGSNPDFMELYNEAKYSAYNKDTIDDSLKALHDWLTDPDHPEQHGYVWEAPKSWQEMFAIAREIKTLMTQKFPSETFTPIVYDSDSNLMITQLAQRGMAYTTNENIRSPQDHYQFNNSHTIGLVEEITGYVNEGLLTTRGIYGSYGSNAFKDGICIMTVGSTGGSTYSDEDTVGFCVGIEPVPCWKNGEGVVQRKYIQQGPSICFFDNQNPYMNKGAWLFYKYLSSKDKNVRVAVNNSYDPVRTSCYSTPFYASEMAKANQHLGLRYDIPYVTKDLKPYYMTSPVFKGSENARDQIGAILANVRLRGMQPADAVARAWRACW